jgi:D-glycero-D-manno-heptose 1,7-bisphosphate phosphatase
VFLDRDGVLNRAVVKNGKSYPPDTLAAFELLEGVPEACQRLRKAGFALVVVTNQPDVRTGRQQRATVEAMHAMLRTRLPLLDILACYHVDADRCACRKPEPGMLVEAAARHGLDLAASWLVGDRRSDILAGQRAGCRCCFIDHHYAEPGPEGSFETVADLREAAHHILREVPARAPIHGGIP